MTPSPEGVPEKLTVNSSATGIIEGFTFPTGGPDDPIRHVDCPEPLASEIVRRYNSHASLVEALENLTKRWTEDDPLYDEPELVAARQALKLSREG